MPEVENDTGHGESGVAVKSSVPYPIRSVGREPVGG